jgi:hypothetical protein
MVDPIRRIEGMLKRSGLALVLTALLAVGGAHAQETSEPERVTVRGRVVDATTRVPLAGVVVAVQNLGVAVQTDSTGQFEVTGIQVGVYYLELSRPGYRPSTGEFVVMREGSFITSMMPLNATEDIPAGRFVGRVTDGESGGPLSDAEVHIRQVFLGGATDEGGWFDMPAVPPGRYAVEFSHLGYATRVDTVDIVSGLTSDVRVPLALDPIEVDPIEVVVERRELILEDVGFYRREDEGFGEFIDLADIEAQRPTEVTDLFNRIPGAILVPDPFNPLQRSGVLRGGRMDNVLRGGEHCYPYVVVDGNIVHRGGDTPAQIDFLVDPVQVAGIEVFPSSMGVPIQYGGLDAACGVIVIWTRR